MNLKHHPPASASVHAYARTDLLVRMTFGGVAGGLGRQNRPGQTPLIFVPSMATRPCSSEPREMRIRIISRRGGSILPFSFAWQRAVLAYTAS